IPGATVTCNAAGTMGMAFQPLTTVRSGDDGRFELTADDSPRIQLRVEADGFVRKLVLVESMRQQIQVVLERGNQVAGTVSDSSGSPVPSFHVAVFTLQSAMQRTMVAHTAVISAEGKFAVGDLPPGDYQVQALAHGMARSRPVAARSGDTGLRITLDSGATLSGQVVDAASKQGLASAKVSVESSLGSGAAALPLTATAITDDDGRFRLSGLGPGPSSVVVAAYRHHGKIVSGLEANPGAQLGPVTIELVPLEEGESPEVEFAGIGAAIGGHQRGIAVQKVFPGGGAADAELATGDIITRVDGASVLDLGFEGSLQRIRGPVGTVVVLTIDRAGDELRQVSVRRKKLRF
ncbi:MAG: carboxypeptidase regulatory-like domain-containing protein, partial [Deltaproteobacteria bacterium]|nr:carboxypeptidase regulatory-like domain-containing protein [Deltaproteobacteria bacterium]